MGEFPNINNELEPLFSNYPGTDSTASINNNLSATVNPTVTDDADAGYQIGSLWITTAGDIFQLTDATVGAAVWQQLDGVSFYNANGTVETDREIQFSDKHMEWFDLNEFTIDTGGLEVWSQDGLTRRFKMSAFSTSFYQSLEIRKVGVAQQEFKFYDNVSVKVGNLKNSAMTDHRIWTLPDATGTIALLSDISGTENLSATLTEGNTTGANDISVDNGQKVKATNGGGELDLRQGADGIWAVTSDSGAYVTGSTWVFGNQGDNTQLGYTVSPTVAMGVMILDEGIALAGSAWSIVISDNTTVLSGSGNGAKKSIFVGTQNSTMTAGVTNSVVVGGSGTVARSNDTAYVDQIGYNDGGSFETVINFDPTTVGNKTQTIQNASGTIALTTDFQTGQTYTETNVTTNRAFDADTVTVDQLADIVGTLIADLRSKDIVD